MSLIGVRCTFNEVTYPQAKKTITKYTGTIIDTILTNDNSSNHHSRTAYLVVEDESYNSHVVLPGAFIQVFTK